MLRLLTFISFVVSISQAALPVDFVVSKLVLSRAMLKNVKFEAHTVIFNNEDQGDNIEFDETMLLSDTDKVIHNITIGKDNVDKYSLKRIVKMNIGYNEYYIEKDYQTLKIKHSSSDLIHLLFSHKETEINPILARAEIATEIKALGRLSGTINRIYGAKEFNTYREQLPVIIDKRKKIEIFEDVSLLLRIKPQIWFQKDTFFVSRFISKKNVNVNGSMKTKKVMSDIQFNNYMTFGTTFMYPKIIEIYHNEILYSRTIIKNMGFNLKFNKSLFKLKSDLKKRTFNKMIRTFSQEGLQILWFLRQYR